MNLFRRSKRPAQPPEHAWPQVEKPPVAFSGILADSLSGANLPYEFQTDGGVWVRLHDMRFVGFEYRVQPPALTIRFLYDDPQWTPPEALATPLATFSFSDVQVWKWEDDFDLFETPVDARGQVGSFDFHPPSNVFSLGTMNTSLLFSAARLAVELERAPGTGGSH